MNVLIAVDKFKGSLSARDVCQITAAAIQSKYPEVTILSQPLADGGEGTSEIILEALNGREVYCNVRDPLMRPIIATYGLSADGRTAFIEMASCAGLQLLTAEERNPSVTTSYGLGEMILDALDRGVTNVILAIGGSATNDAGIGAASALGCIFFDSHKQIIEALSGAQLGQIAYIDRSRMDKRIEDVHFTTLCDVTNPLYGPNGAAHVFSKQKGADDEQVKLLDAGLHHFARIVREEFQVDPNFAGAGAAGGVGAVAKVFLRSAMTSGIQFVANTVNLEEKISKADVIITGEGKFDDQTFYGKVAQHVISRCRDLGKPLIVICGANEVEESRLADLGVRQVIQLMNREINRDQAMRHARQLLHQRVIESLKL